MIVRRQYDLVNTNESVFPVCDKPLHTNKNVQKGERLLFWELCIRFRDNISKSTEYVTFIIPYTKKKFYRIINLSQPTDEESTFHVPYTKKVFNTFLFFSNPSTKNAIID